MSDTAVVPPLLSDALADGDGPAIAFFDTVLSYADVDAMASAVAAGLAERGVRPGDRVGLLLQNDPQFVVALFAVWRAGATAVPLNPMLRPREIAGVLGDAGVRSLVALESLAPAALASGAPLDLVVTTSELDYASTVSGPLAASVRSAVPGAVDLGTLAATGDATWPSAPGADDIAVLAYTSGTTGPAKGAMISHGNLAVAAHRWSQWLRLGGDDVVLGLSPLFHVSGLVGHIAGVVAAGVPLVLMHRFDPVVAFEQCARWRATNSAAPITAYIAMLEAGAGRPDLLGSVATLDKALSGGAAVPAAVADRFEAATGVRIHQGYGLTESTALVAVTPIGERGPVDPVSGALAVGKAVPGTDIAILDQRGEEVPTGTPGEIVARGPQIVPGYWHRPEETAHAIRDGWLHTGDLGVLDDDGWLYVVDRLKDLIVASGYKVWPGEVEQALHRHPDVLEVAVVGAPDDYRGETVVAHVALRPGSTATELDLVAHCRVELAAYKSPRRVVLHDELPKSAAGKVLRRLLRDGGSPPG